MILTDTDTNALIFTKPQRSKGAGDGMNATSVGSLAIGAYGLSGLALYALFTATVPLWLVLLVGLALFLFPTILLLMLSRRGAGRAADANADMLTLLTRSWDAVSTPQALFGPDDRLVYANQPFVDLVRERGGAVAGTPADILAGNPGTVAIFRDIAIRARGAGRTEADLPAAGEEPEAEVQNRVIGTPLEGSDGFVTLEVEPVPVKPEPLVVPPPSPPPEPVRTEASLAEAERRALKIFEEAPFGIAMLTAQGELNFCNQAFQQMMGLSQSEMQGEPLIALMSDETRADLDDRLAGVVAGRSFDAPVEITPDAKPQTTISAYATVVGQNREDGTIILHCLDQTAQRNLELQVTQSQKMQAIGQLAGGIAHDFNNLLTAMIGFCDLLLLRHKHGDQNYADLNQIKQNANRAADLVRQLLAFSRQQTLKPKVLSITDLMSDLSQLLKRLVGANVGLEVTHGRGLGRVLADQGQLDQVIINLVVNARDAMPDGGTVHVSTRMVSTDAGMKAGPDIMPAGEWTVIDVIDQGVGIPADNLDRIFEPFFTTKEVGSGTGLGLSTVYGIVKQCDGYIDVKSEVGKGTTFSIYLPEHAAAVAPEPKVTAKEEAPRDLTGAGTILLVEDEEPVRRFGARALSNKGYTVVEASSGQAALDLASERGEPFDLIVTDIMMPQMDGATLIKHLREMWPDVGIICISGYAEDAFRQKLSDSGDLHFLSKPFSLEQLAGTVKDVMANRRTPDFTSSEPTGDPAVVIPPDSGEGRTAIVSTMS